MIEVMSTASLDAALARLDEVLTRPRLVRVGAEDNLDWI